MIMTADVLMNLRDRQQRPVKPFGPGDDGDDEGPKRPDTNSPDRKELLNRMRRVKKNQSRNYRQRTGE
jgi:hypothetical protein